MPDPGARSPRRCVVIGGGISGLAAAVALCDDDGGRWDVTLVEASDRLGGAIQTLSLGDYLVERGPDMFITDKPSITEFCDRLGVSDQLVGTDPDFRGALVVRQGKPMRIPPGFQLLGTPRILPVLRSPVFSWRGKLRMACEPLVRRRRDEADESVASFVRRRLGSEALERLVQPLVGGIYTGDPERLSLSATLPRFVDMERDHGSLWRGLRARASRPTSTGAGAATNSAGARYGLFASLAGGLGDLVSAASRRLEDRCETRLSTSVTALRRAVDEGATTVCLDGGETLQADAVVLAVPPVVAADLVQGVSPELAASLRAIHSASSIVVTTGHRLDQVAHPLDAYGMVVPHAEGRRVLAVSFASRKLAGRAPEGRVLLRTFVGGELQPEWLERDDNAVAEMVRAELQELLGVKGMPEMLDITRYRGVMPQYEVGHVQRVATIRARVEECPGIELAGNAMDGVGLPDCVESGLAAAKRVMAGNRRDGGD